MLQQRLADGNRAIERIGQNQAIGRLTITNHVKNAFLPVKDVTIGYTSLHSGYAHFFYAHIALHESRPHNVGHGRGQSILFIPFHLHQQEVSLASLYQDRQDTFTVLFLQDSYVCSTVFRTFGHGHHFQFFYRLIHLPHSSLTTCLYLKNMANKAATTKA